MAFHRNAVQLFRPQRFDGIDEAGPAGRQITGKESDAGKRDDGADERYGIERSDIVKKTAHGAARDEGTDQSGAETDADQ